MGCPIAGCSLVAWGRAGGLERTVIQGEAAQFVVHCLAAERAGMPHELLGLNPRTMLFRLGIRLAKPSATGVVFVMKNLASIYTATLLSMVCLGAAAETVTPLKGQSPETIQQDISA